MWIKLELTLAPPRSKDFVKAFGSLTMKKAASGENKNHANVGAQAKDALIQKWSRDTTKENL